METRTKRLSIYNQELQSHHYGTDIRAWQKSETQVLHTRRADFLLKVQIPRKSGDKKKKKKKKEPH